MLSHLPDVLRPISLLDIKDDSSNSKKKIEGRNAKVTKNKVICIESPLHSELQETTTVDKNHSKMSHFNGFSLKYQRKMDLWYLVLCDFSSVFQTLC